MAWKWVTPVSVISTPSIETRSHRRSTDPVRPDGAGGARRGQLDFETCAVDGNPVAVEPRVDSLQSTPANSGLENENPIFQLHSKTMLSTDMQTVAGLDGQAVETQIENPALHHCALYGRALDRQPVILSSFAGHRLVPYREELGSSMDLASIDSNKRRDGTRNRELLHAGDDGSSGAESRSPASRSRC